MVGVAISVNSAKFPEGVTAPGARNTWYCRMVWSRLPLLLSEPSQSMRICLAVVAVLLVMTGGLGGGAVARNTRLYAPKSGEGPVFAGVGPGRASGTVARNWYD